MRISWKSATLATVLALSTTLGVASTSADAAALSFRIKNVKTGKCLQWNGYHKAITQAKCSNSTMKQQWALGGTTLVTLSVPLPGQDCVTAPAKHEKKVAGGNCTLDDPRRTTWRIASHDRHAKTPFVNPVCGLLKTTSSASGAVICGKKVPGTWDEWIID
ncbi:ricin-type beta-trefoil lectin domain protein [Streptomyces cinerochromogenes]|uniref:ricin-type beta-trefoil lectin domain protein n=1 Tax=Streptomyces cinerochromogenes TaxID=66422 RepID=UPI0033AC4C0F